MSTLALIALGLCLALLAVAVLVGRLLARASRERPAVEDQALLSDFIAARRAADERAVAAALRARQRRERMTKTPPHECDRRGPDQRRRSP